MLVFGIIVISVVLLFVILSYNSLIGKRNRIKEALSAIDVYLQNRFDALTQIAETVVAYAQHEKEVLVQLTTMRQHISSLPTSPEKIAKLEQVEENLLGITIQGEAYPDLKASSNYVHLQQTIHELEQNLSASRKTYNANVTDYNTTIASIPTNIIAGIFGFNPAELLIITASKQEEVNLKNMLRS